MKWNLNHLYNSPDDPAIERDMAGLEAKAGAFAAKYNKSDKPYLHQAAALKPALADYEDITAMMPPKAYLYLYFLSDINSGDSKVTAKMNIIEGRLAEIQNTVTFFEVALGKIAPEKQKEFLSDPALSHYRVFLGRIFDDAKHVLTLPEEKIMNLKSLPAQSMWIAANEKALNERMVTWKGRRMPVSEASEIIHSLPKAADRKKLASAVTAEFKAVAPIAEAEINAVFTDKKINDELRGFREPYEATVRSYRNDPKVVEELVRTVTAHNDIPERFYRLKARLLGERRLSYADRAAKIGKIRSKFGFNESLEMLKKIFGGLDRKYADILEKFTAEGRVDSEPRKGKTGGAYCASSYANPTYVLLNHTDDAHSFSTFAHEMGHAFHSELSRRQGPIYSDYSTSLAETASTLFESLSAEALMNELPPKEQVIMLHDRIDKDIQTIFRQIACFNFERDLHAAIRSSGYASKEEIAALHNRNMKRYLGKVFDLDADDGYHFVRWSHIRRFFYVYTYAYGMLVSKALLRRYHADKSFWKEIEKFLSAGGNDSPENILRSIGIDASKPDFWLEGMREIEADIKKLEKLTEKW